MIQKLIVILLLSAGISLTAAGQWAGLYETTSFQLTLKHDLDTIIVPIKLTGVKGPDVRLSDHQPVYVRLDSKFEKAFADAIRVEPKDSVFSAIRLTVDVRVLRAAGTYQVLLFLKAPNQSDQAILVSLLRPAATLEEPTTLKIAIVENSVVKQDPFVLKETGNKSTVEDMKFPPVLFPGVPDSNVLLFDSGPVAMGAGGTFTCSYKVNDALISKLPLGVSASKFSLFVPELEKAVVVPVEISSKRSNIWIIIATFAGILLGTFVRVYLKNRKDVEEIRLKGLELANRIETDTAHIEDVPFKADIQKLLKALREGLDKDFFTLKAADKKTRMETAINTARDAYSTQKSDFENRLKAATEALKTLLPAFRDSGFSPFILQGIATAQPHFDQADRQLAIFKVTDAEAEIKKLTAATNAFLDQYKKQSKPLIETLGKDENLLGMLEPEVTAQFKKNISDLGSKLETLPDNTGTGTTAAVMPALTLANAIHSNLVNSLQFYIAAMTRYFERHFKPDGDPALMGEFKRSFEAWKLQMETVKANPFSTLDPATVKEFLAAASKLPPAPQQRPVRGDGQAESVPAAAPIDSTLDWTEKKGGSFSFLSINTGSGLRPVIVAARQSIRRIFVTELVQLVILSLVLCLILYKTYATNFIGRTDELITLFLMGFSIDITVDKIIELGGGKKG